MSKQDLKRMIEEYEFNRNGFSYVTGARVVVSNLRPAGDVVTADVTIDAGGDAEVYANKEYCMKVLCSS
jgi:hypothetical protein